MSDEIRAGAPDAQAVRHQLARLAGAPAPWLHAEVARRMAQRLPVIRLQPATVLQWWAGAGASEDALSAAYPKARSLRVEPSEAWRQQGLRSQPRPRWWSPRRSEAQPQWLLEAEVPPACCELLWANMMLHRSSRPDATVAAWHRALAVDGFLMFSCLGPDTLKELGELYRRLGWPAPAQAFVDMHDIGDLLVQAGFADPVMDQEHLTLTWPDAAALLAELRTLGGNASPSRAAGLRTPRWRDRLQRELGSLAGADGRLALSFELVYGHAFKAAPRARPGGETAVSLEDMRSMVRGSRGSPR